MAPPGDVAPTTGKEHQHLPKPRAGEPRPAHRPPSPVALLLLAGCGGFLLLVIAAAVLGAVLGEHGEPIAQPSKGTPTGERSSGSSATRYGSPEDNRIYDTGALVRVDCAANLESSAPGPYERFVKESTRCLDRTWRAQLSKRDIAFHAPSLVISRSRTPSSPCRSGSMAYTPIAFYCPTNSTMYYSLPDAAKVPLETEREYLISSPAHEYGHHVQQLTGISAAYTDRYDDSYPDDVRAYTELTRRLELQAQCFAGAFVGANSHTMRVSRARMAANAGHTGDAADDGDPTKHTHGSFAHNRYWLVTRGWDAGTVTSCNTWTASSRTVS